ncbi:MAG: helix-turn-helix domain-containing protein [Alphaproteobacteria bacterium]|jgi:DNA-binding transcriptional MerR regulator|uniref:MerR family transcriptional regulator n=1 Tax=Brevundimonas sp. TaxID=1871086 RepID=UPI001D1C3B7E|nr:helix-turn-helix domain-containing protein [Brevundimonas sp.]MBU1539187.1 helix-turn-helix domain-containing protein [Alphaproteobacteria bacterium]MBU2041538.1 helix-turn-helix domain-containing protein [Alphaproteobacteria bacterium]MBU2125815.1 helix-turn-helix domain-containing protein [Alphaproteobacteria bacterium]MBU2290172.1 helix-turn-helix domain-containing protein [Alphaproteobacteria bacterium]MBU2396734.1 helix-turn-helix domain-containing protein [Alphaproteobacteria bacteriu
MPARPALSSLRTIGKLSAATGVKIPTIRFYEQIGLLPEPPRTASDRRLYDAAALQRLSFIRHARQLGFDLDAIRSLLDLSDHPDRPCGEANAIAERHLVDVSEKIAQLQALRTELKRMTAECAGGRVSACKVIEVLHDHDLCAAGHDRTEGGLMTSRRRSVARLTP